MIRLSDPVVRQFVRAMKTLLKAAEENNEPRRSLYERAVANAVTAFGQQWHDHDALWKNVTAKREHKRGGVKPVAIGCGEPRCAVDDVAILLRAVRLDK